MNWSRSVLSGASHSQVWEGAAELRYHEAPDQELAALAPVRVGRGYRYTTAFRVDDLIVLEDLTQ